MKQRIINIILGLVVATAQLTGAGAVHAAVAPDHIVILALQTGQTGAAGNDFVEIYNPSVSTVDITGWKLQYRAATATGTSTWTTKRAVACIPVASGCTVVLPAHAHLVFSSYDITGIDGEQTLSSGFSDVGGQLRLVDAASAMQDMVGYGTAAEFEQAVAMAPPADTTLVRLTEASEVVDTNNNAADFVVMNAGCYGIGGTAESPVSDLCAVPEPTPDPTPTPIPDPEPPIDPAPDPLTDPEPTPDPVAEPPINPEPDPKPEPIVYALLMITELLPDPLSPQHDETDEFIELFNPGNEPVNATGYTLEAGSGFRYKYVLGTVIVEPGAYVSLSSAVTHIPLSNSGAPVQLLDPTGVVLDSVASYGTAKPGQTWAKTGDSWQWTITATPGVVNTITAPLAKAETKASKAASKSTKKKTTAAKVASAKVAKTPSSSGASGQEIVDDGAANPFNYWLLAPVGVLVFGYVLYEYRQNIARLFRGTKQVTTQQTD